MRFARENLVMIAVALIGLTAGLGIFTFGYARGYSYLANDPAACANCHIMDEHYAAWLKSSHRPVAACNDCHTPHDPIGKYATKARNGFWHSFYFTTGTYPDPLRITQRNRAITEHACRDCHEAMVAAMDPEGSSAAHARRATPDAESAPAGHAGQDEEPVSCIRCHRYVGHLVR